MTRYFKAPKKDSPIFQHARLEAGQGLLDARAS
jgi:hypothetical protein